MNDWRDLDARLRAADPIPVPADDDAREHLLAAILERPAVPARRRPRRIRVLVAAAVVAAACALVATEELRPRAHSLGPVSALAAELRPDGRILHMRVVIDIAGPKATQRLDIWTPLDDPSVGRSVRRASGLPLIEIVRARDPRTGRLRDSLFSARDNMIHDSRALPGRDEFGDRLRQVVRDAHELRDDDPRVEGPAVVDGQRAVRVRLGGRRRMYVSARHPRLLRIDVLDDRGHVVTREDIRRFELLPDTPAAHELLRMRPHPGALRG